MTGHSSVPEAITPSHLVAFEDGLVGIDTARSSIRLDPRDGGRMVSLVIDGLEILGGSEPAPNAPLGWFHGSWVMAPFASRTAHGTFDFEGKTWHMPANFGPDAMHGLVYDRPWTVDGDSLVTELDDRWPFGGSVRQYFELTPDHLTVTVVVANDKRTMPAIIGFHPWFRQTLTNGAVAHLDFAPGSVYQCDETNIPIGLVPGQGTRPWDDSFTNVNMTPSITWGETLRIEISTSGDHWIVCETFPGAFCVEPISGPVNGLATGRAGLVTPEKPVTHSMTISW